MATKLTGKRKLHYDKETGKNSILFTLLCILLFYPPFFRGLFFDKELLPTHIFTFGLACIWMFTKIRSNDRMIRSIPDLLGLAIVGMYFLSIFYGVNTRLAIGEFLKYTNYYMIYLLVRDFTVDDKKNKKTILNVLLLSGAIVSIIGIGSAIGTFHYNGAFVSGRINSTFQYPNALASYLFALFILALGLLQNSESIKEKCFYAGLSNLFIFTFIPTFSRGMWLLAPIIFGIYLVIVPSNHKLKTFIYGFITAIPATAFSLLFTKGIENRYGIIQWGILLVSIFVTVGITYLCKKQIENFSNKLHKHIFAVGAIIIIIIGLMGGVALNATQPLILSNMDSEKDLYKIVNRNVTNVLKNKEYRLEVNTIAKNPQNKAYAGRIDIYSINDEEKVESLLNKNIVESKKLALNFSTKDSTESIRVRFLNYYANTEVVFDNAILYDNQTGEKIKDIKLKYKYIPERFIARINSFTANERSVQGRFAFYQDAFKIIRDYPIFGAGGGAWQTLYFMYQSYMYWSTQTHNYFMQLWIEIGTLGFILYLGFVGMMFFYTYKYTRNTDDTKEKLLQITLCTAWLTLLIHSSMDFDLSLGAMAIFLWTLFGMMNQTNITIQKLKIKNNMIRFIPIIISLLLVLGSWSLQLGQQYTKKAVGYVQNNIIENAIKYFEKATKYDPFQGSYHTDLATIYALVGKKENLYTKKAIQEIEKATELEPYNSKILKKSARIYMELGQFDKGLEYIDRAVEVQPMNVDNYLDQTQVYLALSKYFIDIKDQTGIDMVIDRIPNIKSLLNKHSQNSLQPFRYNRDLDDNLQKLEYLMDNKEDTGQLKKLDKVVLYKKFDLDIDKDKIPDGIRIWNTKEGDLEVRKQDGYISITNTGNDYGVLIIDQLSLQQEKKYKLEINYSSTLKSEDFDIYIYDLSNKSKVIAKLENIKPTKDFTKAVLEIDVPNNVVAEKQRVIIVHRGKGNEFINVKSISIIQSI
ncbi:hypothetical protein FQB35_13500 [Crassaminicella thermophila]|uniref:O-antigen ligase-related domain-containing protein n=1 Tax=Crassaminicella thermophila TaxID=2599308 RepID=A0A5C0SFG0_CRATE|nr:O-antigen ligase family protein [Crassaminicella thermophila]QEK13203.1 hypothetical protein FQB35_13500 [Crassaminicella thermophila]